MPVAGQIATNPHTGDSYEFVETAKDTAGHHVTLKATIHSKGPLVPRHVHVCQDESFEVISGTMTLELDGTIQHLSAGEKVTLPKNVPHNHYNLSDQTLSYFHRVSPALDFDYLIENLVGLAADRKSPNEKQSLIQQLVTLKYLDSKTYLADIPRGLQIVMMNILGPIGRLMGYRAIYKKYSGIEK